MGSLRQTSLFSFEEWIKDTEWDERLQAILDAVPLGPALSALPKPARTGRPEQHDRAIMIRAYVAKAIEQIPTTEALRARLRPSFAGLSAMEENRMSPPRPHFPGSLTN